MATRNWLLFSGFLVLVSSGCGGGSGTEMTTELFCAQKAESECQVAARCLTADMAVCLAKRKSACQTFAASQTMPPTVRVFRPGNVSKCISVTKDTYAKLAPIPAADLAALDDVCASVFQGDVKKDSECTVKYDCQSGLICDKGLCEPKFIKKKGELCANPGEVCEAGAYCTTFGALQRCELKKMLGESCDGTAPCVEALRCDGTCKARLGLGETCASSDDCAPAASYCDPSIGKQCYLGLIFAPNASACSDYGGSAGGTGGADGAAASNDGAAEASADTTENETSAD